MSAQVAQIARDTMDAWTKKDVVAAGRPFFADDAMVWLAARDPDETSREHHGTTMPAKRWLELLQKTVDQMPDQLTIIVHRLVADDSSAAAEVESRGELRDGRLYNMRYTFWFEIRSGLVHELKQYFDTAYGQAFFLSLMSER